jgi:aromatic ring-opening dioxygenase LigB subunit
MTAAGYTGLAMPLVYACICPRLPALVRDDEPQAARTIAALRRVAEELAAYRPETALLVSSTGAAPRSAIGVFVGRDLAGFSADQELAARIQSEAAKDGVPVETFRRWDGGLEAGCATPLSFFHEALTDARLLPIVVSRLEPRFHFEFGRAIGRTVTSDKRRVALICAADLSHALEPGAPGYDRTGRVFDEHYRRAIENWDVKWLVHLDSDVRRRAAEDAVAQTAVLMGALSPYRIQQRVLSYEAPAGAGLLVAAIDVLGPRRRTRDATSAGRNAIEASSDAPTQER